MRRSVYISQIMGNFRWMRLSTVAAIILPVLGQMQIPLSGTSFPQTTSKHAINSELSRFVTGLMESSGIPGISLGVVHTSHRATPEVELKSWGRKTEDGDGADLSPEALFVLASCSKAFLASAVGILMDDFAHGRNVTPLPLGVETFDWQTKVKDMLPDDWELQDEWANEKTSLRDALSHVTGMPRHDYSYGPGDTTEGVVRNLRNLRPAYELRQKWSYNNQMYMLGAYLISKYSNGAYIDFASERLFAPMNMSRTTFWPDEAKKDRLLTQAWTKFGRLIPDWFTNDVAEVSAGPGAVISSAEDMTRWLAVLLNKGVDPASNTTILPRSVFEEITTAHAIQIGVSAEPELSIQGYGLGWWRYSYQGHDLITHSGGIPGFSTKVAFLPDDGLGIVVLANADEKAAANEAIMYRIVEDVLGLKRVDRSVIVDASGKAVFEAEAQRIETTKVEVAEYAPEPLPIDLEALAGTYHNAGYGAFILCTANSTSHHCLNVLADFKPFMRAAPFPSPVPMRTALELYAVWPRMWSTHLRLTHATGATFALQFTALFPDGYGKNGTAFETSETGESEGTTVAVLEGEGKLAKVKGLAFMIDAEAVEARKRAGAKGAVEWADAWFERV